MCRGVFYLFDGVQDTPNEGGRMFELNVSPDLLAYLLAGLVAVLFDWFPGLRERFDTLREMQKRTVMAVVLAVIVAGIFGLGCLGVLARMTCDKTQVANLAQVFLVAVGINQGTHLLFKPGTKG